MDAPGRHDLAEPLLGFLRRALNAPSLGFEAAPTYLASGAQSEIYALSLSDPDGDTPWGGVPLVCRVARNADAQHAFRKEFAVHETLAALDFPVPRAVAVGSREDGIGTPFLVMERVAGRPAMDYVWWGVAVALGSALLGYPLLGLIPIVLLWGVCARVQHRLHRLPVARCVEELAARGVSRDEMDLDAWFLRTHAPQPASAPPSCDGPREWLAGRRALTAR